MKEVYGRLRGMGLDEHDSLRLLKTLLEEL
jgi:hypothetical protein